MTRILTDSMGEMSVPDDALYGPQTARAVANFPVSGWPMPRAMIAALGRIKRAAAISNKAAGLLEADLADAVVAAASEVVEGQHDGQFPVDVSRRAAGRART